MTELAVSEIPTCIGRIAIGIIDDELCMLDWIDGRKRNILERIRNQTNSKIIYDDSPFTEKIQNSLNDYLLGNITKFEIPLRFIGTDFQNRVWNALLNVEYGETITYSELALRVGKSSAVRAVSNAVAMNPISIFVPCHRIVPINGKGYGNYAGGSVVKTQLIELEKRIKAKSLKKIENQELNF